MKKKNNQSNSSILIATPIDSYDFFFFLKELSVVHMNILRKKSTQ